MFGIAKKLVPIGAAATLLASVSLPSMPGPARAAGTSLLLYTHLTPAEAAAIQKLANQWAAKSGNTVKVVTVTSGGFQEFSTLAHSGKGPDLYVGLPDDNTGQFQAAGLLAPVPAGTFNAADYVPGAVAATQFGGKSYSVPFALDTYALVYNKKLVPAAPKTLESLIATAQKFPNAKGQNYGFLFDPTNFYFSYAYIRAAGGYIFKSGGGSVDTHDIGLANAGAIKAYSLFRDLVQKYKLIPADIQNSSIPGSLFQSGKLGMWIDGDWDIATNKKALGASFGTATLPTFGGSAAHPFAGVQVGFVSALSKNQPLAWQLMKYLAPLVPQSEFATAGRIPALKAALNGAAIAKDPLYAAYRQSALDGDPLPNVPEMQAVWGPASNNIDLIITGKKTPQDAASTMVSQVKKGITQQQG